MNIAEVILHEGDCLQVLPILEANSLDSCVTDPPYHLTSIVDRFGAEDAAPAQFGKDGAYARASRGFMGKKWDGGDIAFRRETWLQVYRVLKPGAHLFAFGGTRTFHRMMVAIEDAGFELRDTFMWAYGKGFPKSHSVALGIDKQAGVKGTYGEPKSDAHAAIFERKTFRGRDGEPGWQRPWMDDPEAVENYARRYVPGSPEAAEWDGWGTAVKPAWEPIALFRKPLEPGLTVAANALKWRTGALNIDACRIPGKGRFPANLVHDGSVEVETLFASFGVQVSGTPGIKWGGNDGACYGAESRPPGTQMPGYGDRGSVSRFFYSAKASKVDRADSNHPTVKPVALMDWLVKMVTPEGGTVLDLFAGSGTTGQAARQNGFNAVLIEADGVYAADIRWRLGLDGWDTLEASLKALTRLIDGLTAALSADR